MYIREIEVKNFRLFIDEKITFELVNGKNITVIHGENGAGKTTLLQAMMFAFYGEDNVNLDKKDMILNKGVENRLKNGQSETISVKIYFEHSTKHYVIKRTQRVEKAGYQLRYHKSTTDLTIRDTNGNWVIPENMLANNVINNVFPLSLSSYFLFDGERIKNLGDNEKVGKSDLRKAVSNVLSLDTLFSARAHLNLVKRKMESEYIQGNKKANSVNYAEEIEKAEYTIKTYEVEIRQIELSTEQVTKELLRLRHISKSFSEIKDLVLSREKLMIEVVTLKDRLAKVFSGFTRIYNKSVAYILSEQMREQTKKCMEKYEIKTDFIEGIDGVAVEQILTLRKCICGTQFCEGDEIHSALVALKRFLPPQFYGVMINNFIKDIERAEEIAEESRNELREKAKEYYQIETKLAELNNEVQRIVNALENHSLDKVRETEKRIQECEDNITRYHKSIGVKEDQTRKKRQDIKEYEKARQDNLISDTNNDVIKKRVDATTQMIQYFDDFLLSQENMVREHLSSLTDKIFRDIIHKNYRLIFDENYSFDVVDENDASVPLSEGEKQITSISFITGLVNMAKDEKINTRFAEKVNYDGTEIYPVVMDSPFGSLDIEHRRKVAEKVPELSSQTILFTSSSQWNGAVEEAMNNVLCNEYRLIYHKDNVDGKMIEYTNIVRIK